MQTQNSEITKPCISIITVCFNAQQHIEQTIQSVIAQDYAHIEYIVIDGASTDNTLDIINKYKDSLDYFVSEPDTGISNAMNKGIKAATGDYVLFLHADDYLLSSTSIAEAVRRILTTSSHYDIYAFSILYGQPQLYKQFNSSSFNYWLNIKDTIFHQGALCSLKLFRNIGMFDESLQIAMDYDWFLRAYRHKAKLLATPYAITHMRNSGISSQRDWKNIQKRINEEKTVHSKHSKHWAMLMCYKFWWSLYPHYKYWRSK